MAQSIAAKLKALKKEIDYESLKPAERTGGGFPLGRKMSCVVHDDSVVKLNKNSDVMITWRLVGTGETNAKMNEFVNCNLVTEQNFTYAMADFKAMEIDWNGDPELLPDCIGEAKGLDILVDKWKKDEFENVAIVGLAEVQSGHEAENPGETDSGDEDIMPEGPDESEWTAESVAALSQDDMSDLAAANDIDPDMYQWDELEAELVRLLVE